jgi:hypothetical protein
LFVKKVSCKKGVTYEKARQWFDGSISPSP